LSGPIKYSKKNITNKRGGERIGEKKYNMSLAKIHNTDFIFGDCYFGKAKHISDLKYEALVEFNEDYISNHPNKRILFGKLGELYIMCANKDSELYVGDGEAKWSDILTESQYQKLSENSSLILGYMLVSDKKYPDRNYYTIDLIDTRLGGHNIAKILIKKFKQDMKKKNAAKGIPEDDIFVVPDKIIQSSVGYWSDHYFGFVDPTDVQYFLTCGGLPKDAYYEGEEDRLLENWQNVVEYLERRK
jgi:hypothetical protein